MADDVQSQMREHFGRRADWNLTLYEFERWAKLLEAASKFAVYIRSGYRSFNKQLYAIECQLVDEWHRIIDGFDSVKAKEFDKKLKKIREAVEKSEESVETSNLVIEFLRELHDFKQDSGLGVPTRQEITEEERFKRALS